MKEKTKRTKTNKPICSRNNNERVGAGLVPAHNKGITLIALILTIIVLLILAVVAINAVKGDGIIAHAKNARDTYEQKSAEENALLQNYLEQINKEVNGGGSSSDDGKETEDAVTITAANYGDKVAYSAGGVDDWKIFYKDENYVYIITSDYLNNANLPTGLNMSKSGTYSAYWVSADNFTSTGAADITTAIANKYGLGWLSANSSSTNENARATADLLNVTTWTAKFGNASKGIEAIGGPTLEMFVKSWNEKSTIQLKTENNATGYFVGPTTTASLSEVASDEDASKGGYYVNVSGDTNLYKAGSLYFPYTAAKDNCYGYWLASPSAGLTDYVMYVDCYGYVNNNNSSSSLIGVRPVVSLPSNIIGEKNASGAWTVKLD